MPIWALVLGRLSVSFVYVSMLVIDFTLGLSGRGEVRLFRAAQRAVPTCAASFASLRCGLHAKREQPMQAAESNVSFCRQREQPATARSVQTVGLA